MKLQSYFGVILLATLSFGCIPVYSPAQALKYDTLIVYFPFNSASVKGNDTAEIDRYIDRSGFPVKNMELVQIIGHTDAVGSEPYNGVLSLNRARFVDDYILGHFPRFRQTRFQIVGMGKKQMAGNIDSLNRRVEVVFGYKQEPIKAEVKIMDKEIDTIVSLGNIYFVEDSPVLTGSSQMALPSVARTLKRYKSRYLVIAGYCNYPKPVTSSDDPLFKLSVKRAKVIYDFLVGEGFEADKMSYKGMGNSISKNPNPATPDAMRENMRVEVTVYK